MAPNPDVLIVGGGITGLSAAYECARQGARVALVEARRLGAMASTWTLGGVRQSGRHPAELPLAMAAVRRWAGLAEELDHPTGYRRGGNLRLARTGDELAIIRALVADQAGAGLAIELLPDLASVRRIAPAIGDAVLAASFCRDDGSADPEMSIAAYAAAARRHGAVIREGVEATGLVLSGGRVTGISSSAGTLAAGCVVIAAGVHAPRLLAGAGLDLPLSVQRVCVVQTVAAAPAFAPVFGVANADCAGRQEIGGYYRFTTGIGAFPPGVGGATEAALRPTPAEVADLTARVAALLPVVGSLPVNRVWGGLIDLTPDALPVLDAPASHPGLVIGAGFSGHGFGIGPVSGVILKGLALGETVGFDCRPFRLDRFAGHSDGGRLTLHG